MGKEGLNSTWEKFAMDGGLILKEPTPLGGLELLGVFTLRYKGGFELLGVFTLRCPCTPCPKQVRRGDT